jgi:soluble P-type ATPase
VSVALREEGRCESQERVIRALREHGHHTLMCGDGANDVGALKQAHVGVVRSPSPSMARLPQAVVHIRAVGKLCVVPAWALPVPVSERL